MNDFISKFFGSGGTGSTAVATGGQIGLGLVNNKTKEIEGSYALRLKELGANEAISTQQFNIELAKLNADRDTALNQVSQSKFNNVLILIGILAIVGAVATVLLLKKRK